MVKLNGINSFNKEKGQDKVRQRHEAFQFRALLTYDHSCVLTKAI